MIDQMRCHSFCLFPRHIHGLALAVSFRRTFFSVSSPGDLRSLFRLPPARCPLQTRQKKPAFRYYICCNFLDLVLCKISQFVVWFIYVTCTYFFVSIVVWYIEFLCELCCHFAYFTVIDGDRPKLSNGTTFNDLEWPLTHISRSR